VALNSLAGVAEPGAVLVGNSEMSGSHLRWGLLAMDGPLPGGGAPASRANSTVRTMTVCLWSCGEPPVVEGALELRV
jgi:hypothetical protein